MLISEDSFYRLYQQREAELTRELEFRRVAEERALDAPPRVRLTMAQRLARRLRGVWHHSPLGVVSRGDSRATAAR